MKSAKLYESALKKLDAYIRQNDMRPSRVRNIVLQQACSLPQPFTAEQLIEACAEDRISVGTVYNALEVFVKAMMVHAIERQRGKAATEYEVISGSPNRMRYICQKCGRMVEIQDKAIARLINERKYSNFNLQHFSLFVYGECKICRSKVRKGN